MINSANVARDCGIDRKTVVGFYQILVDALLGYFVRPYNKKIRRDIITKSPKFYLFDAGVANHLGLRTVQSLKGDVAGRSFEHFIFMEILGYKNYSRKEFSICYWQTRSGYEVDFILGDADIAVEVKISDKVTKSDLKGLIAFKQEYPKAKTFVVSQDLNSRRIEFGDYQYITIVPWRDFLDKLWDGQLVP